MRVNESKLVSPISGSSGQALDRVVDVAELEVLREEQPILAGAGRGPRSEARNRRTPLNPLRNRGTRLPGLISQSFVPRLVRICITLVEKRPYSAANGLASISTDSRLWPGQLEIEVTGRRIDEAGAADLERALRGLSAFRAQPSVGTAHDAGQQRQQALEIVAFERRDLEDRARQHVAGRDRLHALGRRDRRPHLARSVRRT